ncbi:Uncharacterized protein TCM_036385 [Theobroma cacao]|uniref:Uncharacterized protein n=1 Tax=Theobroma cacao TaxID=3641 RepID=A0A061FKQ5_THECC|nr:Uncharacterized protein TCM_036385 [Theobroma cacao]
MKEFVSCPRLYYFLGYLGDQLWGKIFKGEVFSRRKRCWFHNGYGKKGFRGQLWVLSDAGLLEKHVVVSFYSAGCDRVFEKLCLLQRGFFLVHIKEVDFCSAKGHLFLDNNPIVLDDALESFQQLSVTCLVK